MAVFRRATAVSEFLSAPAGRYITGETWLVFHVRHHVAGLVMWGTPTPADLAPLFDIFRGFDSPLGARLPRYFDARRLESAEQPVIAQLLDFVQANHENLARIFTAIAFVHHRGVGQAITEGIRLLSHLPFRWADFLEPSTALAWLECPGAAEVGEQVDELVAAAGGGSMLVHDVRAYCALNWSNPRVEAAAREVHLSTRSLQRKLSELGTSFQELLNDVRMARAKHLLRSTNQSIADVAREVGCAPRHFAAQFRKATEFSPREWRARSQAAPREE